MGTSVTRAAENKAIILFDGVCNLCNGAAQFVLKRDKSGYFSFASLQSDTGRELLRKYNLDPDKMDSMVLIENGRSYKKSSAALRMMRKLNKGWPLLYGFIIVPSPIRHAVYDIIARNRYKWFGKQDTCWLPQPEWASRFL